MNKSRKSESEPYVDLSNAHTSYFDFLGVFHIYFGFIGKISKVCLIHFF